MKYLKKFFEDLEEAQEEVVQAQSEGDMDACIEACNKCA